MTMVFVSECVFLFACPSDAEFPFNEERVIPDGVNRDSAIIGGTECHRHISSVCKINTELTANIKMVAVGLEYQCFQYCHFNIISGVLRSQ